MASRQDIQKERQQRADEIIDKLKPCVADVLAKYPVELAYLHGSVARGRPLPSSDIDIAVLLSEVPPPYDQLILEINIQAALEDACHLSNIDVRVINNAPIMVQGRSFKKEFCFTVELKSSVWRLRCSLERNILITCRPSRECSKLSLITFEKRDYRVVSPNTVHPILNNLRDFQNKLSILADFDVFISLVLNFMDEQSTKS